MKIWDYDYFVIISKKQIYQYDNFDDCDMFLIDYSQLHISDYSCKKLLRCHLFGYHHSIV